MSRPRIVKDASPPRSLSSIRFSGGGGFQPEGVLTGMRLSVYGLSAHGRMIHMEHCARFE